MKKVRLHIKGHDEVLDIVGALEKNNYSVNMDGFYSGAADIEFEVSDFEVVEDEDENIELMKKPEEDEKTFVIDGQKMTRSELEKQVIARKAEVAQHNAECRAHLRGYQAGLGQANEVLDEATAGIERYISEHKKSDDRYLAGCGDGAYHALAIIKDAIRKKGLK